MKVDELKYVVGEAQEAKPVYMRFYGKIDEESTPKTNGFFPIQVSSASLP